MSINKTVLPIGNHDYEVWYYDDPYLQSSETDPEEPRSIEVIKVTRISNVSSSKEYEYLKELENSEDFKIQLETMLQSTIET